MKTIMDWEISASGLTQKKVNVGGIDFVYFEGGQGPETIVFCMASQRTRVIG